MPSPISHERALEEVLRFLENPSPPGSAEDALFGERLRQVIAASIPKGPDEDDEDAPALPLDEPLRRRLEAAARLRSSSHPFGEHPDGIGPTLGMDLGRP